MHETWQKALAAFIRPPAALVGIGNRLCGDDAFGPLVIDRVRHRIPWPVWDSGDTPEGDTGRIAAFEANSVLLLDAVVWGAAPGEIGFFQAHEIPRQGVSTHAASLRLFSDLLNQCTQWPVALLGVTPKQTGLAQPLSEEVEAGLEQVCRFLVETAAAGADADSG